MDDATNSMSVGLRKITASSTTMVKSLEGKKPRKLSSPSTIPSEGMTGSFCQVCSEMIEDCFRPYTISTGADARPITIRRSRGFQEIDIDITELASSSRICGFCGFVLSILRGPDGAFLHQVKRYADDNFQPRSFYDKNGILDHEATRAYQWDWNRVDLKLGLKLQCLYPSQRIDQLEMRMHLRYRTQRRGGIHGTQALPTFVHKYLPVFSAAGMKASLLDFLLPKCSSGS
jgi:hypothetical protein